jgi:PAS domain S-box-containing protein
MSKTGAPTTEGTVSSIRRVYLSALCVFGLCLLAEFFGIYQESSTDGSIVAVINHSGRQRMLSQRLVVRATEIVNQQNGPSEQLESGLREDLASFRNVHRALKAGDPTLGLKGFNSEESFRLYQEIDPHFTKLEKSVSQVLEAKSVEDQRRYLVDALEASELFLPLMDKFVFHLTREVVEFSAEYHRTQDVLLFILFLSLPISAFTLFEPLVRRLKAVGQAQDMALRKFQGSEERFSLAVAGSNDGLWDWNVETGDVFYSERLIELLGYGPEEFPPQFESWANALHPDDYDLTMNALRRHLQEHLPFDVEYRCKSPSGEYKWFRGKGQAIWNGAGIPTRMAGSISDITESKSEKLSLESLTERLELALEATNTGLWDWNIITGETYFNDSWYTMLGYQPRELPMHVDAWKELCHPDDLCRAMRELSRYMRGKSSLYRCDQRVKRKDGSWMWIDDVGRIVERDEEGNPLRMIGVHIDIEVLKEREEQLRIAKRAAERSAQAKGEFLANMSHEIRTPMNGVLGMTELLLESRLDEDQFDLASTAHRSAESLLAVINDILDFSKIEAGKIELAPVDFNLYRFFEEVDSLHRIRFGQKDLSLVWKIDDHVPQDLRGDTGRLRQVLVNLVGNALKFTPAGGAVILQVEKVAAGSSATTLRFSVTDTGIGVPKEKQAKIFEAFEQADSSTTRQYGGTGLGLAISARLVELMGGQIGLESKEGAGTVFFFTADFELPLKSTCRIQQQDHAGEFSLPPELRVLVAEDNEVNQKLAKRLLEKSGCLVSVANNGKEAVDLFEKENFDLILMDIQMPVMGGVEATKAIRSSRRGKGVPIVALTAHAMTGDREKYLSLGMDGYAAKPIKRIDLFRTMRELLENRESADDSV